jgi:hypothetical protein
MSKSLNDIDIFNHSTKPIKFKNFKLVCGIHIKYITEFFTKKYIDVSNPYIKISLIFPINEYRHNFEPLGYSENYFYVFLDIDSIFLSDFYKSYAGALSLEMRLNEFRIKSLELIEKQKSIRKIKGKSTFDTFLPFRDGFSRFDSGCPKTEIKFKENIPFYYISYIYVDMLFMKQIDREIIDSYRDVYTSLWKIVN